MVAGPRVARMRVLDTADASKKVRHYASDDAAELPDTVTAGEAFVSVDARPAPSRKTEEHGRVA